MKYERKRKVPELIGRVSTDTKGAPGVFMEATGLWNGQQVTR